MQYTVSFSLFWCSTQSVFLEEKWNWKMLNFYATVSQTQGKVSKNFKNARLVGEVFGHCQQFDDEASYYLLIPRCRVFPHVCSAEFCEADCSNGSSNEPTLPYTWHVLLCTHPVPENVKHRCAVSANRVLLTYVFRGWETKLVWCASLCLSWVEVYKLGREGDSWMLYRQMTSAVPQFGCVRIFSTYLERREIRITISFLSWFHWSFHVVLKPAKSSRSEIPGPVCASHSYPQIGQQNVALLSFFF